MISSPYSKVKIYNNISRKSALLFENIEIIIADDVV